MEFVNTSGWLPSPDKKEGEKKDWPLSALTVTTAITPIRASQESFVERIDNQYSKPWCVAFAVCNAIEFKRRMMGLPVPKGGFSKAWLYAMCKNLDGIPDQNGTYIRTALGVAYTYGLCPDYLCPTASYINNQTLPVLKENMAYAAAEYKITGYARLIGPDGFVPLDQIKQAIVDHGFVLLGSWVERDNWLDGDELILEPKGSVLGGHCTYLFDYDDEQLLFTHKGFVGDANSWGESWGNKGKARMSYGYINWRDRENGSPALYEAWTFTVGGAFIVDNFIMPVPMQILPPGHTMLPFRGFLQSLGATDISYYRNSQKKAVVTANIALKDRNVKIEATEGSTVLKVYTIK